MKTVSINEAARIKGCTRQAIHAAIKAGRLPTEEVATTVKRIRVSLLSKLVINPQRQVSGRINGKTKTDNSQAV